MQQLNKFFASRPSLSKAGVCREAGISGSLLGYILRGDRELTANVAKKLYPVLNRYGGSFGE